MGEGTAVWQAPASTPPHLASETLISQSSGPRLGNRTDHQSGRRLESGSSAQSHPMSHLATSSAHPSAHTGHQNVSMSHALSQSRVHLWESWLGLDTGIWVDTGTGSRPTQQLCDLGQKALPLGGCSLLVGGEAAALEDPAEPWEAPATLPGSGQALWRSLSVTVTLCWG